jgi:hypothetical protein
MLINTAMGLTRFLPILVLLTLAGMQTLRLAAETTAHTQTKEQWATENAQNAKQLVGLGVRYRATERNLKERANAALESYLHVAQQGQLARDDVVRATERLRQLSARIADGAAGLSGPAAYPGPAGADCRTQLATCGRLLAEGASLVAGGGGLAAKGVDLAAQYGAKVNLCREAWPSDRDSHQGQ